MTNGPAVESLYSTSWHHVAELRPRAGRDARFVRHEYRGEPWYVSRNPTTGRVHRITPAAHALVRRMDGRRTVREIWEEALARLGDDAPTQDETIWILSLLHSADVLRCDVPPDTTALFRRIERREASERRAKRNPLAFRIPLLDPDAFLSRWQHVVDPVFSAIGSWGFAAIVIAGGLTALAHAPELSAASRNLLDPESLIAIWIAYPLVKALHELGHAFAVKRWGGEVHEIGILFLVFVPVPYVDASASSVFVEKTRRMTVAGAGIAVELMLASIGSLVFVAAEPGLVRHLAYAVMMVGGVSTLLFNGNPLLRFDGYYVLADAIEIPNLAPRSNRFLAALARRRLLGLHETPLPETAPGERPWLVGYGLAAFVYRIAIMLGIALYLAGHFFFVGAALALATLLSRIVVPVLRQLAHLMTDPVVGEHRWRALTGAIGGLAIAILLIATVPLPLTTRSEGVIWLPEHAHVRAGANGFVSEVLVAPHSIVEIGEPLILTRDPSIEARVRVLEAEFEELRIRMHALVGRDRVDAEIARDRLEAARDELAHAREEAGAELIRSPAAGRFVVANGRDLVGQYLQQGEVVAYVVDLSKATARVVVGQDEIGLLRERPPAAEVRLAQDVGSVVTASIDREVPGATERLPSAALGTAGGGPIPVDPRDPEGLTAVEAFFLFDLRLPDDVPILAAGQRVHVRFDHGSEPIGHRAVRALRRLFLRQLSV